MDVSLMARPCARALRTCARRCSRARIRRLASRGQRRQGAGLHRHGRYAERLERGRRDAIKALATANDFTVDVTGSASSINGGEPRRLPRGRVRPLRPATCSTTAQEAALQDYVEGGGGFVGIGESALLEQDGDAVLQHAASASPAARITGTGDDERAGRRVPGPRAPGDARSCRSSPKAMTETWYTWADEPDGHGPHDRARAREHAARRHVDHERRGPALHRRHEREPAAAEPPRGLVP